MENEIKKSYNPFKMWGFWIGIGIFLILIIRPCGIEIPSLVGSSNCFGYGNIDAGIIILLVPALIFGAIGWGIHSLMRKYKQ